MPDIDKVMKGLKCLSEHGEIDEKVNPCSGCGYNSMPNFAICVYAVAADALTLLKEQEEQIKELRSIVEFWKEKALHT